MGLFGFLKKEAPPEPEKQLIFASTEEFLRGEESDVIWQLVKGLVKFDYDYKKSTVIPMLEQYWGSENCTNTFMVKQVLPYCLFSSEDAYRLNAERLLKLLESRGDCPNATFCLSIFYQIGIFRADDSEAEAMKHHDIALEQKSVLENMMRAISEIKVKPALMMNPMEAIVLTALSPTDVETQHKELFDTLSESDIKDLRFIYTVGIGWLTSLGYPLSTMFLSSPTLHWKQEVATEQSICNLFAKGVPHDCGKWMIKRLIKTARGGDTLAVNALKLFGLDYRYDYS
jgi:hypothetical protein